MAYKFEISPPKRVLKNELEEEDYEILSLAPFKPFPKLVFEKVKVNATAKRRLIVRNPSNNSISAELTTLTAADHGFTFSFTSIELAAGGESLLEITWTPTEAGSWRESIPVRTSSKFKSEIVLISSSISPQPAKKTLKKTTATRTVSKPTVLAKKLVLPKTQKSQTLKPSAACSMVQQHVRVASALPRNASSPCRRQTFLVSAENKENSPGIPNIKPSDISKRFEDFVLSPLNPNLNIKKTRFSAIDDLVMSPVVMPLDNARVPNIDSVDGDAGAHSKALPSIHEESENILPSGLRRETFDVGRGKLPSGSFKKPTIAVPLPEVCNDRDEFSDSLEEASPSPPAERGISSVPPTNTGLFTDSFMDSTIKFDLPLPSEDPRRCSTGVKIFPEVSPTNSLNVRKGLFDMMVSPPAPGRSGQHSSFDIGLDISHPIDAVHGLPNGVEGCMKDRLSTETYVKDRLSTETYVKDRLSTETYCKDRLSTSTYVKDRLSTETYIREHHSRGSSSMNESNESSVLLHHEVSQTSSSVGSARSPNILKSPLRCIEEEVAGSNVERESAIVNKGGSMSFTIGVSDPTSSSAVTKSKVKPKFSRSLQQRVSPRKRLVVVSPTLKLLPTLDKSKLNTKVSKPMPSKDVSSTSKGKSIGSAKIPDRRMSLGGVDSRRLSLSTRLPENKLALSKKEQPVFKVPRGSKKLAEIQAKKSQVLHNLDDILAEVTNVDPFSASTTSDPFLNTAIFNDSAWIERQTHDMIKWLNALLSPPAELEANVDVPAIDVGDLWQRTCRQKGVSLAPSREAASSEQYDKQHRLNTLRKAAAALIRSREVAGVLQKISVRVDQKLLAIREDRDLHVDVGLQQGVLELLLCYNPLWLRIGLEAVYGRTVPLKSNCDYVGLTTFLVHNLLSDAHIVATYSHPTVPHLKLPGYQTELKKFTLKKFLFLVFFLDVAKRRAIIGHDPCLFVRSAKYKESREIVVAFARDLLAGIGDINRYLAALDCRLAHKQTYLDEFEYAVKTLLDLRDGIRLVRVMEIILEDGQLHKGLRVPAISRLQKVHNVDIAMNALAAAGFVVCGGILAKDIVEGHREKTLSFLWQIIYKFQAPRFTSAALVVQRWWRRVCFPREIDRRIRARKRARREAAATAVQAAWRGLLARRRAAALREERARLEEARRRAAVVLQKHWRRHAAQRSLRRAVGAATAICRWFRGAVETRRARADFLRRRAAAVLLQAHCRGLLTRLRFAELRRTAAALRILTWYRRLRAARRMLAAVDTVRGWVEERRQRREAAALTLQRRWRVHRAVVLQRAEFLELKTAALAVQRRWRALKAMRLQRDEFLARRAAASTIQRWLRARRQRERFVRLRAAARLLQERWRGRQLCRALTVDLLFKRRAARALQRHVRAWLAGRRDRARFLRLRGAAVTLQRRVRARAVLRGLRDAQLREGREAAAAVLQRRWRAVQAMKAARQDFLRRRAAAVVLQKRFRGLRDARRERDGFQRLRAAAVYVQRHFRARKQMQLDRGRFLAAREAAVALQRRWRARLAMRAGRAAFVALRDAARVTQGRYRALTAMRRQRRCYQELRSAAVAIQRRFRARRQMQEDNGRFLALREAVVVVQRRWRAQLAMRAQRASFVMLRDAALVVQVRYRALVVMRHDQRKYKEIHSAVFTIQRWFRGVRETKELRNRYLCQRQAAVCIQECWRAQRAMKHERQYFLALQQSVVNIQRRWRAAKVGRCQLQAFKEMRMSAVRIQAWWRATSIAQKEREQYQLLLASVRRIQVQWRMRKVMMKERSKFLYERTAVIVIQKYARGYLARQRYSKLKQAESEEKASEQKISAATKIQAFWRGYQSRKKHEEETGRLQKLAEYLNSNGTESQCMKDRIYDMCFDLDSMSVGNMVYALNSLCTITALSPDLCKLTVENHIVNKLFTILTNINRGVADGEIAKHCFHILLSLCKFSETAEAVWKDGSYLHLYPILMKKWLTVDDSVLLHILTILWTFSQSPQKAQVIASDERLKSTIQFLLNKYKNKKSKNSASGGSALLPLLQPNWGSLRKESRPFSFDDTLYGLKALCYKLKLSTNVCS